MSPESAGRIILDGQDTILHAALDDVARLDEDLTVAQITDNEFLDVAGFGDPDQTLLHRLAQGERHGFPVTAFAVNQIDGEVVVGVGAGKPVVPVRRGRCCLCCPRHCDDAGGQNGDCRESVSAHAEVLLSEVALPGITNK